jgi:hypothetical protein
VNQHHRIAGLRMQRLAVQIQIDEVDQGATYSLDEPLHDDLMLLPVSR